jgi:hypothetical protein
MASAKRNELIHRLIAGCCEICEARTNLEVHHVRKLADLNRPGRRDKPDRVHLMAKRRRKTLVICRRCREDIHAGGGLRHHRSDHWRAGCRETGPSRSGRGRRKRTRTTGTSSAAYFT